MKKLVLLTSAFVFLFTLTSWASGNITINGKVQGFDDKHVMIKSKTNIYHILKDSVGPMEQVKLKGLKAGQKLALTVPFSGVAKVRHSAPARKSKSER